MSEPRTIICHSEAEANGLRRAMLRADLARLREMHDMGFQLQSVVSHCWTAQADALLDWCVLFCDGRLPAVIEVEERYWVREMDEFGQAWGIIMLKGDRTAALLTLEEGDD